MWTFDKVTPYISFTGEVTGDYTLTLVNDCEASVQYQVVIGDTTQTVTLDADGQQTFTSPYGTEYTVTWVGGTDSSYSYIAPTVKEYTGQFGANTQTVYYLDGQEYDGDVSDTLTYGSYTMSAGTLYAVTTLKTFTRTKGLINYTYTNINDPDDTYSASSASGARDKIQAAYSDCTVQADSDDLGYAWVFKPVTRDEVTSAGNSTVTVTTTAVKADKTGTFKVAALNVDGMPPEVNITAAGIDATSINLNNDGPQEGGSTKIGQYIQQSGIDLLALSEDFNYYSQINAAATSYTTGTQRLPQGIPTSVGVAEALGIKFPLDTDGLNLMYKNNLTVTGETMTPWNEHYSPTTFYGIGSIGIDVPDQNGADGMINKGFRFYQAQVAPGVVLDVYILHMDAETSKEDNDARASQIDQLMAAVNANHNGNPIIIMGDTNCRYTRDPLQEKIIGAGFSDPWIERERNKVYPQIGDEDLMVGDLGYDEGEVVDKVFYKDGTNVHLEAIDYSVDAEHYKNDDGTLLGDHPPVIVEFKYSFTSSTVAHDHEWSTAWTKDAGYHWHECTADNCTITMNSQKDGYKAHSFEVTNTTPATCTVDGSETLACSVCGYSKTEVIHALGHRWDNGTPNDKGGKTYTCAVCHATYEDNPEPEYSFEFEVTLDNTTSDNPTYNVGDTVTAKIYLKSDDDGANFAGVGFKLNVPTGLTFTKMVPNLENGIVSTTGGNLGFTLTGEGTKPIAVTGDGVLLATATFKVNDSFTGDSTSVSLGLSTQNVTEPGMAVASKTTVSPANATLYNIRVTLNPGNATINGLDESLTLYAKYNESGLYSNPDRTQTVESINLAPNSGYRLADTQWTNDMANFAAIAGQTFTESKEYTVQTVETCTINFVAGANVTGLTGDTTVTVDKGTEFSELPLPEVSYDADNYTLAWYNGNTPMTDDTPINSDLILTAKATANQVTVTMPSDDSKYTISNIDGINNEGKATYNQDITFTVTPAKGYACPTVSYTVNGGESHLATVSGTTYTIPGTAITGDIQVYVSVTQYYTITFTNGSGVNALSGTAYVKAGDAGLFTDTSFTDTFTVPTPTATTGYRLANDTTEPLWSGSNGQNYTTSSLSTTIFEGNTTLTAQAIQQWSVTFNAGGHGTLGSTEPVVVDNKTAVPSNKIPTVTPDAGYEFTGWSNDDSLTIEDEITGNTTFTATYSDKDYTLTLTPLSGVTYTVKSGNETLTPNNNGTYTVTHGQDVIITVNATNAKVTSVSYTIGNTTTEVTNFTEPFTIDGDSITGPITVNVQATNTYQVTVKVEGGHGKVNEAANATVTVEFGTTATELEQLFTFTPDEGYEVDQKPNFTDVTGPAEYTVTFKDATYDINVYWEDEDTQDLDFKDPHADAIHDTDVTFTPHVNNEVVYAVWYTTDDDIHLSAGEDASDVNLADDSWTKLTANEDGEYTIEGEDITGNITIFYDTVEGNFTFITGYMAAPAGEKIAVLDTPELTSGGYSLGDYGDLYWSDKYDAYVCFVANDEDADSLAPLLSPTTVDATEIDYSGDVNGDGLVDPTDATIISAALHGYPISYTLSDLMRFRFDVCDDQHAEVTTQDIMWVLDKFTHASSN